MTDVRYALFAAALLGLAPMQAAAAEPARPMAALRNPLAVHSLAALSATRHRPLFSPTRRPPPAPVVARADTAPPPPAPPDLVLAGVVMEAKGPLAIARPAAAGAPLYLHVGDTVSGWKVTAIERRRLVLALDSRTASFTLFDRDKVAAGTPAPEHHTRRVLEVNAAGVLRSRRVETPDD